MFENTGKRILQGLLDSRGGIDQQKLSGLKKQLGGSWSAFEKEILQTYQGLGNSKRREFLGMANKDYVLSDLIYRASLGVVEEARTEYTFEGKRKNGEKVEKQMIYSRQRAEVLTPHGIATIDSVTSAGNPVETKYENNEDGFVNVAFRDHRGNEYTMVLVVDEAGGGGDPSKRVKTLARQKVVDSVMEKMNNKTVYAEDIEGWLQNNLGSIGKEIYQNEKCGYAAVSGVVLGGEYPLHFTLGDTLVFAGNNNRVEMANSENFGHRKGEASHRIAEALGSKKSERVHFGGNELQRASLIVLASDGLECSCPSIDSQNQKLSNPGGIELIFEMINANSDDPTHYQQIWEKKQSNAAVYREVLAEGIFSPGWNKAVAESVWKQVRDTAKNTGLSKAERAMTIAALLGTSDNITCTTIEFSKLQIEKHLDDSLRKWILTRLGNQASAHFERQFRSAIDDGDFGVGDISEFREYVVNQAEILFRGIFGDLDPKKHGDDLEGLVQRIFGETFVKTLDFDTQISKIESGNLDDEAKIQNAIVLFEYLYVVTGEYNRQYDLSIRPEDKNEVQTKAIQYVNSKIPELMMILNKIKNRNSNQSYINARNNLRDYLEGLEDTLFKKDS